MIRRYLVPLLSAGVTVGAVLLALFTGIAHPVPLLLAAVGAPVTALLLAIAVVGPSRETRSPIPAMALGAFVVPILVLLVAGLVAVVAFALVEPVLAAASDLFGEVGLGADGPGLLEVITSPLALFFLVELAVVAPLAEETLKPLGAMLLRPRSRAEAFLFGAAAGAGFAAVENLLYASGSFALEGWLSISVLRSMGAALHLLGPGLIALGLYESRAKGGSRLIALKLWGLAVGIHALWNGSIAVAIILFTERGVVGLGGTALTWGIALTFFLAAYGAVLLGALVLVARWVARGEPSEPLVVAIRFDHPRAIAAWATLAASLLVPVAILVLAFPGALSL
jgi:RsiW-degrading membrane proteinase PrsW (M82 family)